MTPFVRLAEALTERGHSATLFTHLRFCKEYNRSGIDFVPIDSEAEFAAYCADGYELNSPKTVSSFFKKHIFPSLETQVTQLMQKAQGKNTVLVTSETPGLAVRLAAECLSLPYASVLLYPAHVLTMRAYESLLQGPLAPEVARIRLCLGLTPNPDVRFWWNNASGYIAAWPEWFFRVEDASVRPLAYGGFIWADNLEADREGRDISPPSRVLITGGSAQFAGADFFELSERACEEARVPTTIVNRYRVNSGPSGTHVRHVAKLPSLAAAMASFELIIHHGGLGTIGQAIGAGVPQLILAAGGDRPDNGERVQQLGVGRYFPRKRWTSELISRAVIDMLSDSSLRDKAKQCMKMDSPSNKLSGSCELLERLATKGVSI